MYGLVISELRTRRVSGTNLKQTMFKAFLIFYSRKIASRLMISQQVNKEIKDNAAQLLSVLNFRGRITIFSLTNSNLDVEFI